jgi:hypothetical protein
MLRRHAATIPVLFALIAGLAVLALPGQASAAKKPCWERVIDDWLADGRIDGKYSVACYQQALQNVQEDLRDYSNVTDVIAAAMQNALRNPTAGGGTGSTDGGGGQGSDGSEKPRELQSLRSPYRRAIDNLGTTSSDSLPIPLLVLAGLGGALLVTAGGLAAAKRIRARRPTA